MASLAGAHRTDRLRVRDEHTFPARAASPAPEDDIESLDLTSPADQAMVGL